MATGQLNRVVRHLQRAALSCEALELNDGQLLERYLLRRDELAFEALVRRHGAMVLNVCRRILGNVHDAEDAFQATFLVLVRKAGRIVPRHMVGNWLYGVASRTATKARTLRAKRAAKEAAVPPPQRRSEPVAPELEALLDQELARLPDKYRAPLLLCELEGKTRKEAARRLSWPEGTVATRLAHARKLLAQRLKRHGVSLSAVSLAAALSQGAVSATVPAPLVVSTVKAATAFAAGQAGAIAAPVAILTQGVLKAMFITRLKIMTAGVLLAGVIGVMLSGGASSAQPSPSPSASSAQPSPAQASSAQPSAAQPSTARPQPTPAAEPGSAATRAGEPAADAGLPRGPAPVPALIGLTKQVIVVRTRYTVYEPVTAATPSGKVTTYQARDATVTQYHDRQKIRVLDTAGKSVDAKLVLKALKEGELLALVTLGSDPDPLHLRLVKEGTWIFVLTAPPPTVPAGPPIPPTAPVPGALLPPGSPPLAPAPALPPGFPPLAPAPGSASGLPPLAPLPASTPGLPQIAPAPRIPPTAAPPPSYAPPLAPPPTTYAPPPMPYAPQSAPPVAKFPTRIGQIVIVGSKRTPDALILKSCGLYPGAVFTAQDLRAAEQVLMELERFKRVTVNAVDGHDPSFRDILIRVEEKDAAVTAATAGDRN